MKNSTLVLAAAFSLMTVASVFAADVIAVNNKICPVSGQEIKDKPDMKPVMVEHNGKSYRICCSMCKKDFTSDPEKYSAIADQEVAAQ